MNVDEAVKNILQFFKWRDDSKVDDVRQDIVYGGKDSPYKFPFGKVIIDLAPQIIIASKALDKKGRPLGKENSRTDRSSLIPLSCINHVVASLSYCVTAVEMFDFSPREVLEATPIADYLLFLTYTLEYRALVLEQMSHEREQK